MLETVGIDQGPSDAVVILDNTPDGIQLHWMYVEFTEPDMQLDEDGTDPWVLCLLRFGRWHQWNDVDLRWEPVGFKPYAAWLWQQVKTSGLFRQDVAGN